MVMDNTVNFRFAGREDNEIIAVRTAVCPKEKGENGGGRCSSFPGTGERKVVTAEEKCGTIFT